MRLLRCTRCDSSSDDAGLRAGLDARLGTGRSSHTATEKHVEEVRQRHHAAQERHRQAPHDAAAAAEVEKHAHHLKLAEEAHARSASRKEHLERRRSHKRTFARFDQLQAALTSAIRQIGPPKFRKPNPAAMHMSTPSFVVSC